MVIRVCGLSHKTAPVEIREAVSFPSATLAEALPALRGCGSVSECVILSTCNRVELYAAENGLDNESHLAEFLAGWHGLSMDEISGHLYSYVGADAVRHLLRVACGLESMVLGETQVLGQVRNAFEASQGSGCAGIYLRKVFGEAVKAGRRARIATGINKGAVCVGSVAVKLAREIFGDLSGKTVLIIGAGKMGERTLRNLMGCGVGRILVANRTYAKAAEMASQTGGEAVEYADVVHALGRADIAISSTGAPHALIGRETVAGLMSGRGQRPLFFIDISVPRNVDARVREVPYVHVYDIDDLDKVRDENLKDRVREIGKVELIIEEAMGRMMSRELAHAG